MGPLGRREAAVQGLLEDFLCTDQVDIKKPPNHR